MTQIGTMLTGAGVFTSFQLTWVPQYIHFVAATQIAGLKVSVLGDGVIADLDAAGLSVVYNIRQFGQVENGYTIPLANGLIRGKNCEIVVENSGVDTPVLYGISMAAGNRYIQCLRQTALANSGVEVEKFAYLGLPAIAAADVLNITYVDGLTQKVEAAELPAMANMFQSASINVIDNVEGMIDLVQFTPVADRTLYLVRYSGKDLSQSVF
ncbi:hypothetical protein ES705_24370 [subsurface metagenome]